MIGALVRFQYENEFSEARVRQVAEAARGRFVGLPGLRFKAFTVDVEKQEALNFYVWESEDAARAFFTPELIERVTGLYGVRPSLQFVNVAAFVENPPTKAPPFA
ncbi:MAG: YdhR family protein [Betaproteobacteria bacterium]|nr:YdhR family protein [Betaproteobacteria bacterium]